MALKKRKASSPFLRFILVLGALVAVGVSAGIPLYLDSPKRTNANDPSRVKTATPVPIVPGATNTPTVCPTANPNISCISQTSWCSPATGTYPVYTGTNDLQPGTGVDGGDAAGVGGIAWCGTNFVDPSRACALSQTAATPLPPSGHHYLKFSLGWTDGYYAESNYITNAWNCSWSGTIPEIDLSQATVIEFWARGKDGGEDIQFQIMTGSGTCGTACASEPYPYPSTPTCWYQVASDKLHLDKYLEGGLLSTTWQRVRIPVCDIQWTGAAAKSPPQIQDMSNVVIFGFLGFAQAGSMEFYVADLVGKKF
ncbi:MAG: hypothetical protein V4498_08900 [candidate division FCPU426 bacterium]